MLIPPLSPYLVVLYVACGTGTVQILISARPIKYRAPPSQGGLQRLDGSRRRRTVGGVFLWLVKQRADAAQRALIWPGGQGGALKRGAKAMEE